MFSRKGVLKICSKCTGEHPCRSVISIKLLCNFIDIAHRHGCSPEICCVFFRTPFPKCTSGWLLLKIDDKGLPQEELQCISHSITPIDSVCNTILQI